MRLARHSVLFLLLCLTGWAQQSTGAKESFADALASLPSLSVTRPADPSKFTNMLDSHAGDSQADVAVALPLIKKYLQSPDQELRHNALFVVYALARRPNSAIELASILPDVYSHLSEQDIYLRKGTLLAINTLSPTPPDEAFSALLDSLGKADVSDEFGRDLVRSLAFLRPKDEGAQNAILAYLDKPGMDDNHQADLIESLGYPQLGEILTQKTVTLANAPPSRRIRDAAIRACTKIGPRAVNPVRDQLYSIKANTTETSESRGAAVRALSIIEPAGQQTAALIDALQKTDVSDDFGIHLAGELARTRPNDQDAQNAVLAYLNKPGMDDSHKAALIDEIAYPYLAEKAVQEIVDLANISPQGKLRNAAIKACGKIGPRAVIQIKDKLDSIIANPAERGESRNTANMALSVIQ